MLLLTAMNRSNQFGSLHGSHPGARFIELGSLRFIVTNHLYRFIASSFSNLDLDLGPSETERLRLVLQISFGGQSELVQILSSEEE